MRKRNGRFLAAVTAARAATNAFPLAERFAMTFALVIGQGGIAAVVIAIKALGDYRGDARGTNRMASIRVLGTLSSVIWALLCFGVLVVAKTRLVP